MVLEKQFRSDLYYRLKIGYINLPPLRTRISDIEELVAYFIKAETSENIKISSNILDEFNKYKWLGNVRELESTIKYMLAVRTSNTLTLSDLPDRKFFEEDMSDLIIYDCGDLEYNKLNDEMSFILKSIANLQNNNIIAGREKITERLNELGYEITQNQIRTRLEKLEETGFISKRRGRYGAVLTEKGVKYLQGYSKI